MQPVQSQKILEKLNNYSFSDQLLQSVLRPNAANEQS